MKKDIQRTISNVFLFIGLGLLTAMLINLDVFVVVNEMLRVGWYFLLGFGCYLVSLLVSAYAWQRFVDPKSSRARYFDFLRAFWAGHAINQVTPGATMGELTKGTLLGQKVDVENKVASIILFNFTSMFVIQVFTMFGPILLLFAPNLPNDIIFYLFLAALCMALPVIIWFLLLRSGVAEKTIKLVLRLPVLRHKDPSVLLTKAKSIDENIRQFRKNRSRDLVLALFCHLLVRLASVAELWCLLLGLLPDEPASFLIWVALMVLTSSQLLTWAATMVPGQIGILEGGGALLFKLIGMDPVIGFSLELLRRCRKVLGIAIGIFIATWLGVRPFRR